MLADDAAAPAGLALDASSLARAPGALPIVHEHFFLHDQNFAEVKGLSIVVLRNWEACRHISQGSKGALFEGFKSRGKALVWLELHGIRVVDKPAKNPNVPNVPSRWSFAALTTGAG